MPPPLPPLLSTPTPTTQFDSDIILAASLSFSSGPPSRDLRNINANLLDVVTTTVFVDTGPTVTTKPSDSSKVPVGAIVGGLLGGVAIALLTVGGWIWWGRMIERRAKRDRERKRKTSTSSSVKQENGSRRVSESVNGRESARTSKRSLQQGVHPFVAAATASQKSVTFADDEAVSAATAAPSRDSPEVKISISIAEKDRVLNPETEKDIGKTAASSPVRGFSIRGPTPTPPPPPPPPPARRSHSSERGYVPTRRSPLGQSSPSLSPSASLSSRKRTPSAPQPGTGEPLGSVMAGTGSADKHKSSPPAARSLSVLPIFGSKDVDREREGIARSPSASGSSKNNTKLFLTRTPILKSYTPSEAHGQNKPPVSATAPDPAPTRSSPSPVPPSPAQASVSLSLPGGANLPSLSLPLSPPTNPGSVNEALAALSSLDMAPLSQPRPAFRQGAYASSSVTGTNSSGVSGASESQVSAPSLYSQSGTATDIDPRISNRK